MAAPELERRTRAIDRHAYAPDASHFLLVPEEVVVAGSSHDVAALMREAVVTGRSITFRSGGTSLSGQSVSDDILVDVRKNFRGIQVLEGGLLVKTGPGSTVRQVNAALLRHGRRLGPDPASEVACTVGGVVADNSSGMACGITANSYATVAAIEIVLPSGTIVDTAVLDADTDLVHREPELVAGLLRLRDRVRADPESVATIERFFAMKNTMGYGVNAFLDFDRPLDILRHLLIGSEGTLGFISSVTWRTVPILSAAATALVSLPSLDAATRILPALVASGAATIELMDASALHVAAADPVSPLWLRDLAITEHAALLIEYQASTTAELDGALARGRAVLTAAGASHPDFTTDAAERAELWHVRKGLYAAVAGARPRGTTALLEDIVVPLEALGRTCAEVQRLLARHGYPEGVIFGHAKDGNIHFMLTDDFAATGALERFAAFTDDLVDLVLAAGGSLKAEHGTGRMMAPFVERQYGTELFDVMREVKRLFDPRAILNPGVIIPTDPRSHLRDIAWAPPIELEADRCVECGYCEPVCPSRDLTLTPRQRIVVRRALERARLEGDVALAEELAQDEDYDSVQTCAVDGMCQTVCPVLINTGDLVKRLRTTRHAPLERTVWAAAAGSWSAGTAAASAALSIVKVLPAPLVALPNRIARAAIGSDVVPLWSPELPAGGRRRGARAVPPAPVAAYLPACVNAMFGPDTGPGVQRSFEELCSLANLEVSIVTGADGLCCGTPWSSKGLPEGYERMAERVVGAVRSATGDGRLPLLCDASSCTEGLRAMLATRLPEVRVIDIVTFVANEVLPRLPETSRMASLTLHPTCSSTRLGIDTDLLRVAEAVADDVHVPRDWGCCAFAGDRGLLHPELTASATRRQAAQVRESASEVHASCNRTCELGMTRATGSAYRHVVEELAELHRSPNDAA